MTLLAKEQHVQPGPAGLDDNGQDHLPMQHLLLFPPRWSFRVVRADRSRQVRMLVHRQ
jgi:hypothetical protein